MALTLARELAVSRSVALVDFDHERPSLMEKLGVIVDEGLEKLDGESVIAENICVRSVNDNVTLVPLTTPRTMRFRRMLS